MIVPVLLYLTVGALLGLRELVLYPDLIEGNYYVGVAEWTLLWACAWPLLYLGAVLYFCYRRFLSRRFLSRRRNVLPSIAAMRDTTRVWWHGLASAAIGSFATAAGGALTLPAVFNLSHAGLLNLLKLTVVPAAVTALAYLRQSPLPPSTAAPVALLDPGIHLASTPSPPQPAPPRSSTMSFLSTALAFLEKRFEGFFKSILGSDASKTVEGAIVTFVKTDIGKLAVDAVQYASTLPAGTSDEAARTAAVAALKADLKTAGKDAESIAASTYNLFIEMAYTYLSGTIPTTTAAPAPATT